MLKTTSDLITGVNLRCFWPATGGPYDDSDILALATDEIQGPLFTLLLEAASDLYSASVDLSLTAGTPTYRIPAAAAAQLRDVLYVESNGQAHQLDIMPKDKLGLVSTVGNGTPKCFYLDGHRIGLWPTPANATASLRIKYRWHPNTLVSGGTTIASTDSGAGTVTPAAAVGGWTTAGGATWDVLADTGAHGLIEQFTATYAATPTMTSVAGLTYTDVRAGDILAQEGETHVPQIPTEAFALLAQEVAVSCLRGQKDRTLYREQLEKALRLREDVVSLLERRVQGESTIYVPDTTALAQL